MGNFKDECSPTSETYNLGKRFIYGKFSMKVLMLTGVFSPCPQSASQRVSSFAQVLSSEGFEVVVVTTNRCIKKVKEIPSNGDILVYDLRCPRLLRSISSLILNPIVFLLYFLISVIITVREKVDVVFASVPNGETAIAGFFVSKLFRSFLVVDMRDLYPPPPIELPFLDLHTPSKLNDFFIGFFSFLYRNSSRVTCVDENIRQKIIASGVVSENTLVVPNGADTVVYTPLTPRERERTRIRNGLPVEKFIFVYAGSLIWYYPIDQVILGLRKLSTKRSDFRLLIISPMNYSSQEELAKKLGLESCVEFRGPLSVNETAEILSACDVGIVVYRGESYFGTMYGSKIFSYMSCGLPILASGPPGSVIDTIIRKYRIGFFIGEPDEKHFERGFSYFLNDIEKAKNIGMDTRKVVENFYDRRKLGLKLAKMITEMCER